MAKRKAVKKKSVKRRHVWEQIWKYVRGKRTHVYDVCGKCGCHREGNNSSNYTYKDPFGNVSGKVPKCYMF